MGPGWDARPEHFHGFQSALKAGSNSCATSVRGALTDVVDAIEIWLSRISNWAQKQANRPNIDAESGRNLRRSYATGGFDRDLWLRMPVCFATSWRRYSRPSSVMQYQYLRTVSGSAPTSVAYGGSA